MDSSSSPGPFGEPHGCDGDGCASDLDTWPIHNLHLRGEPSRRLCSSCILLSERSLYCCCCFFILFSPSSPHHNNGDPLVAPPSPTVTCLICRSAVAHLACLYPSDGAAFVCPACRAAEEGRPFTYAPPSGEPLDLRASRVILIGTRMALALLQREAAAARAAAQRLAREADEARMRACRALRVVFDLDTRLPSWNSNVRPVVMVPPAAPPEQGSEETDAVGAPPPQAPHEDRRAASGEGSQANVEETLVVLRRRATPLHLAAPTIGAGCATAAAAAAMAPASSSHTPLQWSSSGSLPPLGASVVTVAADDSSSSANPTPARTLNLFGIKEMAMAAAEAARANPPPAPRTLQLFPAPNGKARASPKMPRTLQLFEDKIPDGNDEEM